MKNPAGRRSSARPTRKLESGKSADGAQPTITVFDARDGSWIVGYQQDEDCFTAPFEGAAAEQRAKDYCEALQSGKIKVVGVGKAMH